MHKVGVSTIYIDPAFSLSTPLLGLYQIQLLLDFFRSGFLYCARTNPGSLG